ncbi:hypothetical protein IFO68_16410 [Photobacterium sp. CAU 1568]|uniref:Ferric oxidoreductase domain-containing protein n=1 Tax=Photobacterium arenosum TaxID=2774143 RepID=A0ABR9BRR8_9GAMM|nr:hypothetical protein [Photobacterium arenosum]MBD8514267.1 hypothetical protein [Photobacterium arenosum]
MLKINRVQCLFVTLFVVFLPLIVWSKNTGDPLLYFTDVVPAGQGFYVLSKLAALISMLLFGVQALIGLFHVKFSFANKQRVHRWVGASVLLMILLHVSGFIAATSLRSGHFTGHFLLPDIDDYYHARITVGLVALILILSAVLARIWLSGTLQKWGHRFAIPAFYLAAWHALTIGTESRHPIIQMVLIVLMILIGIGILRRLLLRPKPMRRASTG